MGHTPYGYRIENGKAVIDEAAATQVRELYKNYLTPATIPKRFNGPPTFFDHVVIT